MFRKNLNDPWKSLAVELSVQIQDLLDPSQDYPPYEYFPESIEVLKFVLQNHSADEDDIQRKIAEILSATMEFNYQAEDFAKPAKFLVLKLRYFDRYFDR